MRAVDVMVTGLVQGVGFRWSARRAGERIGVNGWVRNRPDGAVEAHVEGDDAAVDAMIAWLRHGPMGSIVDSVTVEDGQVGGDTGFAIVG